MKQVNVQSVISALFAISLSLLVGCSASQVKPSNEATNGLLTINRVAPPISKPTTLLGFLPNNDTQKWLCIDSKKLTVSLMDGDTPLATVKAEGAMKLTPGEYSLSHKQRSPLWYAGDDYFIKRGLPVPPSGDTERYRRGALGDFALFLDKDTSLHSAPIWTDEVGGLRIQDEQIKKIYYSLDVGSRVEIK